MSTYDEGSPGASSGPGETQPGGRQETQPGGRDDPRPSLTVQVRRRRTDQQFFLRLRDAIQQNHKALERLGT
jgi:hypothetical protein